MVTNLIKSQFSIFSVNNALEIHFFNTSKIVFMIVFQLAFKLNFQIKVFQLRLDFCYIWRKNPTVTT